MPADTRYRPPTKVQSTEIPWLSMVNAADPERARALHHEQIYPEDRNGFSNGRKFFGNNAKLGAYADD